MGTLYLIYTNIKHLYANKKTPLCDKEESYITAASFRMGAAHKKCLAANN